MKCKDMLETVSLWLKTGRTDAENLIDFPWEVESREGVIKALHPKYPVEINILCDDDIGVLRLQVILPVETIGLDSEKRILIYRKLLKMNALPLTKTMLIGDDDYISIASDLSIKSLSKTEFNDALALLLATLNSLAKTLDLTDVLSEAMAEGLIKLVRKHISEGYGRDRLLDYLVKVVGLTRSEAETLLREVLGPEDQQIYL